MQEDRIVLLEVGNKLKEDRVDLKNLGEGMSFVEMFREKRGTILPPLNVFGVAHRDNI